MRKLILIGVLLIAGWYYFVESRKLDDDRVRDFYRDHVAAIRERNADAVCDAMAPDFASKGTASTAGRTTKAIYNRQQFCDETRKLFDAVAKIAQSGVDPLKVDYRIESIALSPDRKTATVETASTMEMLGGVVMKEQSIDTLTRNRGGRVVIVRSESTSRAFMK